MPRSPEALARGRVLQAAPWTRGRTGLLPARSGRRPRVTPAEGAGAGLSAHRGGRAGDPASCEPACVPPPLRPPVRPGGRRDARARAPEPLQPICASGQGEWDVRVALEGDQLPKRGEGKRGRVAGRG